MMNKSANPTATKILTAVFSFIILATAAETMLLILGIASSVEDAVNSADYTADSTAFMVMSVYIPLIIIESELYFNLRYFIHVQNKTRYKTAVNTVFFIIEIIALSLSPHLAVSLIGLPFPVIPMDIGLFLCGAIFLHTAVRFVWWAIEVVRRRNPNDVTEFSISP